MRATRGKAEQARTGLTQSCHLLVEDLAIAREGRTLVAGVSFRLAAGQIAEITGPNGVGKSTLLRVVGGFIQPASGRITWTESLKAEPGPLAERLHYVGHLDGLKAALTASENLAFAATLLGAGPLALRDALERLGLARIADLPVGYLSAGQRRRVALARLLVSPRPLWLLDEPLTALDREARSVLRAIVADHVAGGGVVLAATHEPLGVTGSHELRLEVGR